MTGTSVTGRIRPVVTLSDFSSAATCYAGPAGRVRPGAAVQERHVTPINCLCF